MSLTVTIGLVCISISALYVWVRRRISFFERNGFLYEQPAFPFGNLNNVGRKFHIVYKVKELYDKFKGKAPAFGIYFFLTPNVVITDLELVKNVLIRDFDNFHNRGVYFNEEVDPLGAQLFTIEDAEWKRLRTKLTPTFTSGKMKTMFETVVKVADLMEKQFSKDASSGTVEVKETLAKFTTDVIGNVAFGLEMNSLNNPDAQFRKMGAKIFRVGGNVQLKLLLASSYRKLARALKVVIFPKDVSEFFMKTIRETVNYRKENHIKRNDVMNLLIDMLDDDGTKEEGKISFNELAANCFVFFFAGKFVVKLCRLNNVVIYTSKWASIV